MPQVLTDANGDWIFPLDSLPPGDHKFDVVAPPQYRDAPDQIATIVDGQIATVPPFQLTKKGGGAKGRVVDAVGTPLSGIPVDAVPV